MKKSSQAVYSTRTRQALEVLAGMIKAARKERNMSQAELAERLGVSRLTAIAIEKGNPRVAVGTVFEAAAIVGVPLIAQDQHELDQLSNRLAVITHVLPKRSGRKSAPIEDDF